MFKPLAYWWPECCTIWRSKRNIFSFVWYYFLVINKSTFRIKAKKCYDVRVWKSQILIQVIFKLPQGRCIFGILREHFHCHSNFIGCCLNLFIMNAILIMLANFILPIWNRVPFIRDLDIRLVQDLSGGKWSGCWIAGIPMVKTPMTPF